MTTQSDARADAPRRVPYRELLLLFAASRALIYGVAAMAVWFVPKAPEFVRPGGVSDWLLHWDGLWYLDIIEHGYRLEPTALMNVGYFPLFPWVAKAFALGGLVNPRFAAYSAAFVGLWLACVLLWRLVAAQWKDEKLAWLAVLLLLVSPVSFFFSTLYSESWFLPLTIGCFFAARKQRWWLAGLLGALAAFTRFVGLALVVPLAWEFLEQQWLARSAAGGGRRGSETFSPPKPAWGAAFACLLPVAGYLGYCLLMWVKFGNPLMYMVANAESGRHFTWFWGLFARPSFTGLPGFYQVWFAGAVLISFALLAIGVLLRLPTSFAVYVLTFGFIYISARFADSLPRYFAGLFPLYVAVALLCRRWPRLTVPLVTSSLCLQTLSVVLFVNGYWFT